MELYTLLTGSLAILLVTFVYTRGVKLNYNQAIPIKVVLSAICSGASVFIWDLLNLDLFNRPIFSSYVIDQVICFGGVTLLFFFFLTFDLILANWRKWFPAPVGFDLKNLDPRRGTSKSFVYASQEPKIKIKGDGWIRQ